MIKVPFLEEGQLDLCSSRVSCGYLSAAVNVLDGGVVYSGTRIGCYSKH